jgi:hypothetical protein
MPSAPTSAPLALQLFLDFGAIQWPLNFLVCTICQVIFVPLFCLASIPSPVAAAEASTMSVLDTSAGFLQLLLSSSSLLRRLFCEFAA